MSVSESFRNPGKEFRGKPFWSWNGKLDKDELVRQIRIFKEMGLGGAFMHSRVGLDTAYLSKEWFDLIDACAEEGIKSDMEMWLYDEDRWPSGAAGGMVTKDHQYRARSMEVKVLDASSYKVTGTEAAIFSAKVDGANASDVKEIKNGKIPSSGKILVFELKTDDPSPWYNGETYLDTLSDKAVEKFIEVTHEAYRKNNGKHFGKIIPGIFTDEPNYAHRSNYYNEEEGFGRVAWTGTLPEVFKKRYGYDIMPRLPELYFNIDGEVSELRQNYFDCLTYLFSRAFGKLIYDWCEKNNMQYTGHVLAEGSLRSQTAVVGSAMRFYEFMQAPGIDILCSQGVSRDGKAAAVETITAKQCASVCAQQGRKLMLSELYGVTGWNFSFTDHKAVGDWQAAFGVNLRCHHLSWYTMMGEAKRDYPASISFQSAWYKDYNLVEDYFSRVNAALAIGKAVRNVGVIHPIETAWSLYNPGLHRKHYEMDGENALTNLDSAMQKLQNMLLQNHYYFDYIDEEHLNRFGSVANKELSVGLMSYKAVVVPPVYCLRKSTMEALDKFVAAGGTLIPMKWPSKGKTVQPRADVAAFLKKNAVISFEETELVKRLSKALSTRNLSLKKGAKEYGDVIYGMRHDEKEGLTTVFLCRMSGMTSSGSALEKRPENEKDLKNSQKSSGPLKLFLPYEGYVSEWNPFTGEMTEVKSKQVKGGVEITTEFAPYGSRIYAVSKKKMGKAAAAETVLKEIRSAKIAPASWKIERSEPNAFTLDRAEFSVKDNVWLGPLEILKLDRVVRDICNLPYRGGNMVQPWARKKDDSFKKKTVELAFMFKIETMPESELTLVLENPKDFKAKLNESSFALKPEGNWIDNSFYKVRLPAKALKLGMNVLKFEHQYGPESGFEAMYITGEFGFRRDGLTPVITALPKTIKLGDWKGQGFDSYTGAMAYVTEIKPEFKKGEKVFIRIPEFNAVCARLFVNGKDAGAIICPPYEFEISKFVESGKKAEIKIVLTAGRRNLFGQLHHSNPWPRWTGPGEFVSSLENWTDEYVLLPVGLMKAPEISYRA